MPYARQRPRIPPNGTVSIRLSPEQRDLFLHSAAIPHDLGHALHHAAVRESKLALRVDRASIEALIVVAARATPRDRRAGRSLAALLRYLESLADRFDEAEEEPAVSTAEAKSQ